MNIIMCCSTLNTKGGMISVVKNYLDNLKSKEYHIQYIPTHFNTNKYILMLYFFFQFVHILYDISIHHYDVAHLHVAERGSFWRKYFLMKFYHKYGIKVVMHHHGAEFEDFYNKCSDTKKNKIRNALEEADINLVLSKRLVSMIKDKAQNAKVEFLYNAVKCPRENPYPNNARNVLFLGRLGKRKGIFDLLLAIKKIDDFIPKDIKFYLCGDMGEDLVKQKVTELGLQHRIAHIGWIDGNQKEQILANTMINCLPSYNEGLPMTILETMAKGIPNISTNIASIPEVICDGENGYLIAPGDVEALSNRLVSLINNPDLRKKFSDNSFITIRDNFSLDRHISKLRCIYDKLLTQQQ